MRLIAAVVLSLTLATAAHANRQDAKQMQAEQYEELLTMSFKGKSPEHIAKYFVQPNGFCAKYAMKAMKIEHGDKAVDLMVRLLKDKNPIMRYSAVNVLSDILLPPKTNRRSKIPTPMTPQAERFVKLIDPLIDDKSPAVQQAVADALFKVDADNEVVRRAALKMANSDDLTVRSMALKFGQSVIQHPDTQVKIGMAVSPHTNISSVWGHAHELISAHKDSDVCRQGIPTLANYLLNVGNTLPVRGMFSGDSQMAALATLDAQWDAKVEKMKGTIPAVCCVFVRVPYGWMGARKASLAILKKMTPASADAIRAYAKKERQWLSNADQGLLVRIAEGSDPRAGMKTALDYLEYIADCVADGKPVTKECPIQLEATEPEIPEINLEL